MVPRRSLFREQTFWLAALDGACLVLSVILGVKLRHLVGVLGTMDPLETTLSDYLYGHLGGWFYFCGSVIVSNYMVGGYGIRVTTSRFNLFVNWLFSLAVALLVLTVTSYAWVKLLVGRGVLLFAVVLYALVSLVVKYLVYGIAFRSEVFSCRAAVMGNVQRSLAIRGIVEGENILPLHKIVAYLRPAEGRRNAGSEGGIVEGIAAVSVTASSLETVVTSLGLDMLIVCHGDEDDLAGYQRALRRVRFGGVEVLDDLAAIELYNGRIPLAMANEAWLMQASMQPSLAVVRRFKRILDVVAAMLLGVFYVPAGLFCALLVKLSAPRSRALYVQERAGQFGRPFRIFKLRTMIDRAEENVGAVWSGKDDPRVTRLGWILRKFRLDEIPQLYNVLRGDMSLVGPRPERPELADELERHIPHYRERENVPPGLTGWAQVQYPYTDNIEDAVKKIEYDLYYVKHMSVGLDLQIMLRTVRIMLFGKERSA